MTTKADELMRQASILIEEAARLRSMPQDVFENGDVIQFTHTFQQKYPYTYVAIKSSRGWYTTGRGGPSEYSPVPPAKLPRISTWEQIVDWADEGSLWAVTEWGQVI